MIETRTLLIVGAGASVPYGYPTGEKLKESLCDVNNFYDVSQYMLNILNMGARDEVIGTFCQQFKASQTKSIDAFLANRGSDFISKLINGVVHKEKRLTYEECGKLAIASYLIKLENCKKLLEPDDDHWLEYLWNCLNDVQITDFQKNQLKIVSFNYDRVIEGYFQTTIENTYGISPDKATKLRESIELVHMYGNLQDLTERSYGEIPNDLPSHLQSIVNCIRVIPEDRDINDKQFTKAKNLIGWADKICFIGFGFDSINVRRLGFPDHDLSNKTIYSTHYGRTAHDVQVAQKLLLGIDKELSGFIDNTIKFTELKTCEYFRHAGVF